MKAGTPQTQDSVITLPLSHASDRWRGRQWLEDGNNIVD